MKILRYLLLFPFAVLAEGPVYILGDGDSHTFSCTPPTQRTNGQSLEVAELAFTTLHLMQNATTVSTAQADVHCNATVTVDDLSPGQFHGFFTVTDTGGRESELSTTNGPFFLDLAAPNAPTVTN